jgi:hypothetical protein
MREKEQMISFRQIIGLWYFKKYRELLEIFQRREKLSIVLIWIL